MQKFKWIWIWKKKTNEFKKLGEFEFQKFKWFWYKVNLSCKIQVTLNEKNSS